MSIKSPVASADKLIIAYQKKKKNARDMKI